MAETNNVNVNYEDERFTKVEDAKQEALTDLEQTYGGMINESDKYFQSQIDASKQWADKQSQLQQEQTDFAIEQIEQQKEQSKKDYIKEQSGTYVDWQKQSAKHGVEAEKMASAGLTGTGYSESSQVGMYNTYQNRVAVARESYNRAVLNYNNAIKDARLQNNSKLAEIAFNALQQQLELSLQGFQYKNNLILEQASKKTELDQIHYQRYQDVLQQINAENALAEEIRQYNESLKLQQEELQLAKDQFAWQKAQAAAKTYSSVGGNYTGKKSPSETADDTTNQKPVVQEARDTLKVVIPNVTTGIDTIRSTSAAASATAYLNKLIASGASKDKVSNEISLALRNGAITAQEAAKLRSTFTPRGLTY